MVQSTLDLTTSKGPRKKSLNREFYKGVVISRGTVDSLSYGSLTYGTLFLTGEIFGPGKMTFKIKEIGSLNYGTLLVISYGSFFEPQ